MKKLLKRSLLVLLVLLLLAQIPFIYRRYQTGKLAQRITELESRRIARDHVQYKEYKGVIHAHTSLGGHSTGSFDELITAANKNGLDFVLMTEHVSDSIDTAALTLNGVFGETLFIGGNELDTSDGDRFLLVPGGGEAAKARKKGTASFLDAALRENKLALVTYPERFKSWKSEFDGIEVFSLHTSAKQMNPLAAAGDLIWTYPSYPELMIAKGWTRPDANLAKFDEIAGRSREEISPGEVFLSPHLTLFAGTDAHSNIGFHILGDDAGNSLLGIKLDSYETIFRTMRVHVLLGRSDELNADNLIQAIRFGQIFVGFDGLGDTSGFMFEATVNDNWLQGMGGTLVGRPGLGIRARAPQNARFVFFRDGSKIHETAGGSEASIDGSAAGVYRVEVYRDELGPPFDKMPWIISNPIYVR